MEESQQKIHHMDFSGKSLNASAWLDLTLSDMQEQIQEIKESSEDEKETRIRMMQEYIRGLRDGNRFNRENPF